MKLYFNHSLMENASINEIVNLFLEIGELRRFCQNKNIKLHFYEELWNIRVDEATLLKDYVHKLEYGVVKPIIEAIYGGPFFHVNFFHELQILIYPDILLNSFGEKLLKICFNDKQKEITSFVNEEVLSEENYKIIEASSSNVIDILNFKGTGKLQIYLDDLLEFKTIDDVFNSILENTKDIIILDSARKSAKKHDFRTSLFDVYYGIKGLEEIELPMVLENKNELERQNNFYEKYGLEISGETSETLKKQNRNFQVPGMGEHLFDWHIKIDGTRTRIHYWIDKDIKKVYIGHCGKHLPTAAGY